MIFRNKLSLVGLCLSVLLTAASTCAEENPAAPSTTTPAPATGHALRKIVVTESVDVARTFAPPSDSDFVVLSPGLSAFDAVELNKRLATGENLIIQERLLAAIAQVVENFLRQNDHPNATVMVPSQNIAEGILRLIVQLGPTSAELTEQAKTASWKIRNINMQGARWFSESLLREKLRIEQGGMVKYADLDSAISWTNNNPFRRVRVKLDPIPNTGEADLTIAVQDALPLRLGVTYDNAGNEVIGQNRFIGSFSYANLWGRDHQLSYQYVTTDLFSVFQAHGLDYRVPLSWRHFLQFSASYLHAEPEFYDGLLVQDGETITSDVRYTIPLRTGTNPLDVYAALAFKQSNNTLTWDPGFSNYVVPGIPTNIFQLTLGSSGVWRDKRGAWGLGANLTWSPGGVNSRNSEFAFNETRPGAEPRYTFASFSVQRLLNLKHGWDISSRAVLQVADGNLLPSEQLTMGGGSSVRGFRENIFAGDNGFVFTTDLLTPAWRRPVPFFSKHRGPLETRFLVFYDAANSQVRQKFALDPKRKPIASTGIGVRMNLANNFSLSADYGWQLTTLPYEVEEHSRGHIRVMFAY